MLSINALEYSVPAVPADPDPSKTSFRKRVLLTQFTSTGCTYCPIIVGLLRELSNDKVYSGRFVLGASHADMTDYPNGDDPASFSGVAEFMSTFDVRGFPTLTADLGESLSNYDLTTLKALVDGMLFRRHFCSRNRGEFRTHRQYPCSKGGCEGR